MQPRKALENDEIISAVSDGRCKRPPHAELADKDYYADEQGNVYSLNGEEPKQIEAKRGWGGFRWVVLATVDGWHRYHVGELVAETFLQDKKPADGEYTVQYKNGDNDDNRVENLKWITKLEASALRQSNMVKPPEKKKRDDLDVLTGIGLASKADGEAQTEQTTKKRSKEEEIQALLDRNRKTQGRLDALQADYTAVLDALRAFGEHTLSAELRLGHPDTPVIESNKGKANHGVITVADFRRAKETLEAIERRGKE